MVKHFTKENLGWTSMGKYPECSFKGSDTRLILHFLIAFLERPEVSLDAIASNGYVAAKAVHCVLRKIFSCKSALFKRCEAYEVLANLNLWSEKFRQCAQQCFDQQLCFLPSLQSIISYFMLLQTCTDSWTRAHFKIKF